VGRALVFFLVQAPVALLLTGVCASASCLAALVDRRGGTTRRIAGAWGRALLRLLGVGVCVSGLEHAPAGPAVYAANHASALDILVVFGHLPVDFRIVYKKSLSPVPLLGWAIWLGGHVPVDRGNPFRARRSLEAAARRIRGGTSVVVFPEGTRSPDGAVRRFKRGSFSLALHAGVPVVPVSLVGVKAVVPHGLSSVRPGLVRVVVHPVVPVEGRSPDEAEALAEEVRRVVARGCAAEKGVGGQGLVLPRDFGRTGPEGCAARGGSDA
jgi:1-acyl-sn-glycerol-3-phosphate acyltransferase